MGYDTKIKSFCRTCTMNVLETKVCVSGTNYRYHTAVMTVNTKAAGDSDKLFIL